MYKRLNAIDSSASISAANPPNYINLLPNCVFMWWMTFYLLIRMKFNTSVRTYMNVNEWQQHNPLLSRWVTQ